MLPNSTYNSVQVPTRCTALQCSRSGFLQKDMDYEEAVDLHVKKISFQTTSNTNMYDDAEFFVFC